MIMKCVFGTQDYYVNDCHIFSDTKQVLHEPSFFSVNILFTQSHDSNRKLDQDRVFKETT